MSVQTFKASCAGMGQQLLWRSVVLAAFFGLALTQSAPATVAPESTQVTVTMSSNLTTTTIPTKTNATLITAELTNGTSSETTEHLITSAPMTSSLATAITEPSPTTVTMETTGPVSTPKQHTMQPKTTQAAPEPGPTKQHSPVSTATGIDLVTTTGSRSVPPGPPNNVALYLLLPLVVLAGIAMLAMIISYLRKRIRLDKLRHQLLPLYNFDPQEGEDWETELLTEPRPSSHTPLTATKLKPTTTAIAEIPKLRFSPDTVDV